MNSPSSSASFHFAPSPPAAPGYANVSPPSEAAPPTKGERAEPILHTDQGGYAYGRELTPPAETPIITAEETIAFNPLTSQILNNISLFTIWKRSLCESIDHLFSKGYTIPSILNGIQASFQPDPNVGHHHSLGDLLEDYLERIDLDVSDYDHTVFKSNLLMVIDMFYSDFYKRMKRELAHMRWNDQEFDNMSAFITQYSDLIRFVEPNESVRRLIENFMDKLPTKEADKLKWIISICEHGDIRTWREAERLIRHELTTNLVMP